MKGLLKGIQSVLVAMVLLCMIGTGVILWFNKGDDEDVASQPETETAVTQAALDPENAFPDAIPVSTISENNPTVSTTEKSTSGHTHSYTPKVLKDSTCMQAGQMKYSCSCGDFYIESIAPLEHKAGEFVTIREATTTSTGLKQQKCTRCGAILKEETIAKLTPGKTDTSTDKKNKDKDDDHVHSYVAEVTTEPTCTENGVMTYTCTCDSSYTASIPATGHPSRQTIVTEATCTEPGTVICSCSICKAVISQDSTSALGHHFGKWVITTQPTKEAVGKLTRTCTRCNEEESKDIPKTTDPGSNHQHYFNLEVTKEASCTEGGTYTYTCSCGETFTENVNAYGHTPGNWVTVTVPTEEGDGLRQRICRRCGEVVQEEVIKYTPAHTHDAGYYTKPVTVKDATCSTPGYRVYMCKECGASYTTEIDKLAHKFVTNRDGTRTCAYCGIAEP